LLPSCPYFRMLHFSFTLIFFLHILKRHLKNHSGNIRIGFRSGGREHFLAKYKTALQNKVWVWLSYYYYFFIISFSKIFYCIGKGYGTCTKDTNIFNNKCWRRHASHNINNSQHDAPTHARKHNIQKQRRYRKRHYTPHARTARMHTQIRTTTQLSIRIFVTHYIKNEQED
jgi:hypothetical protein